MRQDGACEVEQFGETMGETHELQGAGMIFGCKQVIAVFELQSFADIFEGVAIGPADADGFFGQSHNAKSASAQGFLVENPAHLIRSEETGEAAFGVGIE